MNLFLYEKVGRRAIDHEGSISEAGTAILPPITPNNGIPKGARPLWRELESSALEVFGQAESHIETYFEAELFRLSS